MDFDTNEIPDSMDQFDRPTAGSYHFKVTDCFEDAKGQLVVDAEILAGEPSSQAGKVHREWFSSPKPEQAPDKRTATIKRQLQFFVGVGLTNEAELKAAKASGKKLSLEPKQAVSRQFCGQLSKSEYEGKVSYKLGYDIWPTDSPKAKGIPLGGVTSNSTEAANTDTFGDAFD